MTATLKEYIERRACWLSMTQLHYNRDRPSPLRPDFEAPHDDDDGAGRRPVPSDAGREGGSGAHSTAPMPNLISPSLVRPPPTQTHTCSAVRCMQSSARAGGQEERERDLRPLPSSMAWPGPTAMLAEWRPWAGRQSGRSAAAAGGGECARPVRLDRESSSVFHGAQIEGEGPTRIVRTFREESH